MADRALFISWRENVPGREERGLEALGLIVERLREVEGVTGGELGRRMQLYQEAIAQVPQTG